MRPQNITKIIPAALFAATMLTAPAMAEDYKEPPMPHAVRVNPPKCEITTVENIKHADPE